MAAEVAQLSVVIRGDAKDAENKISGVNSKVKESAGFFKTALSSALGFAGGAAIVSGVGTAVNFVKDNLTDMVRSGMDANREMAVLTQGLKSTHDASGMTAQGLDDLSTAIMNNTGVDDDSVKAAEQMLLTFTNIGKNVFPAATQAVADIATRMNKGAIPSMEQMQSVSIMLGKALNDPLTGVTALQRAGIQMTVQEKEQIKTMMAHNDIAGAQAIIMKEVSNQFEGSAAAAGHANGGIAILTAQFDNMKQTVGQALVPIVVKFLQALTPLTGQLATALPGALNVVMPLFTQVWNVLRVLAQVIQHNLQPAFDAVKGAFDGFRNAIKGASDEGIQHFIGQVTQLAGELSDALNGAILAVLPIIEKLGAWFISTGLPALQHFGDFVENVVSPALAQFGGFLLSTILPALGSLGNFIVTKVVPAAEQLYTWFVQKVVPILEQVGTVIATQVLPAAEQIAGQILSQLVPALENLIGKLAPVLVPALQVIGFLLGNVVGPAISVLITVTSAWINVLAAIIGRIGDFLGWLGNLGKAGDVVGGKMADLSGVFQSAWAAITGIVSGAITTVVGWFQTAYEHSYVFQTMVDNIVSVFLQGKALITGIWSAITGALGIAWATITSLVQSGMNAVIAAIRGGVGAALAGAQMVWDNIKAPFLQAAKWFEDLGSHIIQGLVDGVRHGFDLVRIAMQNLGQTVLDGIKSVLQIHSPSAALAAVGSDTVAGFAQGINANKGKATSAAAAVGKAAADSMDSQANRDRAYAAGEALIQSLQDGTYSQTVYANIDLTEEKHTGGTGANAKHYAGGGIIPEMVVGRGVRSGSLYTFAERGPETVVPNLYGGSGAASSGGGSSAGGTSGGMTQHIIIQLDGRTLAQGVVKELPNVVRFGTGIKQW